jgi:hypothetical protein
MATLPRARTQVSAAAGAPATGTDIATIIAPVPNNADSIPRQYTQAKAVYDYHGYAPAVDLASIFATETQKPFIFVGVPITTVGAVGQVNTTGNSGSSTVSIAAGGNGTLDETEIKVVVKAGGTIGSSQIVLDVSLDNGLTYKSVRLGTASSYAIPYLNATISFGAGDLVTDDVILTAKTTAPKTDSAGMTLARTNLAAQQKQSRSMILVSESPNLAFVQSVQTQINAYKTANDRASQIRVQVRDHLSQAAMSKGSIVVTTQVTFAEVGGTGDTITRATGSWLTDGVLVGDLVTVTGSASNNITTAKKNTGVTATVLTLDDDDLAAEVGVTCTLTFSGSLTFSNSGETVVRNRGSWIADGFRAGQTVTFEDSVSNDGSYVVVTATTSTLTFASGDIDADEVAKMTTVTVEAGELKSVWAASIEAEYATIDNDPRVNLGAGRGRKESPFLGGRLRRPVQWAALIREYQHDLHIPTWKKDLGPLQGWDLMSATQVLVEYDDRVDGQALSAARFTSFRTWANGPNGAFISLDLTRDIDGGLLSYASNANVVNLADNVTQNATENIIGSVLQLNSDGTATSDSLKEITTRVNQVVQREVLKNAGEGQRSSFALWTPDASTVLSGAEAELLGVLELELNGVIHSVLTTIKVS